MKERRRTSVTHFRNNNFKHKMKRLQIPQKLLHEKFYVREKILGTRNWRRKFIKIYFLKNAKKICKPNNRDLNRDWISYNNLITLLIEILGSRNVCGFSLISPKKIPAKIFVENQRFLRFWVAIFTAFCLLLM